LGDGCLSDLDRGQRRATGELGVDADFASLTRVVAEFDIAIDEGEEGVVATYTNIIAWFDFGATLPDNNATGGNKLSIIAFHA